MEFCVPGNPGIPPGIMPGTPGTIPGTAPGNAVFPPGKEMTEVGLPSSARASGQKPKATKPKLK